MLEGDEFHRSVLLTAADLRDNYRGRSDCSKKTRPGARPERFHSEVFALNQRLNFVIDFKFHWFAT